MENAKNPSQQPSYGAPAPGFERRAVIDVGTNSVKLLVADVAGTEVRPLAERSEQTRLGRGFYENHRLQPAAIAHTARAVAGFAAKAREFQAASTRVIATSAARDAVNRAELVAALEDASRLPVQIISGEQEADWVFRGVISDPKFAGRPLLIVDAGGGSTEFVLGDGGHPWFRRSFALGTVRLMESARRADPPTGGEWERCRDAIGDFLERSVRSVVEPELRSCSSGPVQLVGTGGTTSIMARIELGLETFERDRIEALRLSLRQVRRQREQLWGLSLAERKKIAGLPADRADVILMGIPIYEALMEKFGFPVLSVSTRGLRFAAIMDETV